MPAPDQRLTAKECTDHEPLKRTKNNERFVISSKLVVVLSNMKVVSLVV